MSLYRQPGQTRRRRRLAALAIAAVVVVAAMAAVLAARGGGEPSRAERAQAARSAASAALDGLELLQIEYGQAVRGGRVVAPTEYTAAQAHVQRSRDALTAHADDLAAVDPTAPREIAATLDRVAAAVRRRVDSRDLTMVVRAARKRIRPLAR